MQLTRALPGVLCPEFRHGFSGSSTGLQEHIAGDFPAAGHARETLPLSQSHGCDCSRHELLDWQGRMTSALALSSAMESTTAVRSNAVMLDLAAFGRVRMVSAPGQGVPLSRGASGSCQNHCQERSERWRFQNKWRFGIPQSVVQSTVQ